LRGQIPDLRIPQYHEILNEVERNTVLTDLTDWLNQR